MNVHRFGKMGLFEGAAGCSCSIFARTNALKDDELFWGSKAAKGWKAKGKKEDFHSLLSRKSQIQVQSLQNKCEGIDFLVNLGEIKLFLFFIKRS